jgi:zinc/manganese transport system ATP-binding protein
MDRVVYLAGGRAVAGRTDEVIRTEVLTKLYGHQVDVLHVNGRVLVVAG